MKIAWSAAVLVLVFTQTNAWTIKWDDRSLQSLLKRYCFVPLLYSNSSPPPAQIEYINEWKVFSKIRRYGRWKRWWIRNSRLSDLKILTVSYSFCFNTDEIINNRNVFFFVHETYGQLIVFVENSFLIRLSNHERFLKFQFCFFFLFLLSVILTLNYIYS